MDHLQKRNECEGIRKLYRKLFKSNVNDIKDSSEEQYEENDLISEDHHIKKPKLNEDEEIYVKKESELPESESFETKDIKTEPVINHLECSIIETITEPKYENVQEERIETDEAEIKTREAENASVIPRKTCLFILKLPKSQNSAATDDVYLEQDRYRYEENVFQNPIQLPHESSQDSKGAECDVQELKVKICSKPEYHQQSLENESHSSNQLINSVEEDEDKTSSIKILDLQDLQDEDQSIPPWMQWRNPDCAFQFETTTSSKQNEISNKSDDESLEDRSSCSSLEIIMEEIERESLENDNYGSTELNERESSKEFQHRQAAKHFQTEDTVKPSNQNLVDNVNTISQEEAYDPTTEQTNAALCTTLLGGAPVIKNNPHELIDFQNLVNCSQDVKILPPAVPNIQGRNPYSHSVQSISHPTPLKSNEAFSLLKFNRTDSLNGHRNVNSSVQILHSEPINDSIHQTSTPNSHSLIKKLSLIEVKPKHMISVKNDAPHQEIVSYLNNFPNHDSSTENHPFPLNEKSLNLNASELLRGQQKTTKESSSQPGNNEGDGASHSRIMDSSPSTSSCFPYRRKREFQCQGEEGESDSGIATEAEKNSRVDQANDSGCKRNERVTKKRQKVTADVKTIQDSTSSFAHPKDTKIKKLGPKLRCFLPSLNGRKRIKSTN